MNVEEYNDEMICLGKDLVKGMEKFTEFPFKLLDIGSNQVSVLLNCNKFVASRGRVTLRQTKSPSVYA